MVLLPCAMDQNFIHDNSVDHIKMVWNYHLVRSDDALLLKPTTHLSFYSFKTSPILCYNTYAPTIAHPTHDNQYWQNI